VRPLSFVGLGNASVHLAISSLKSDSISLRLKRIPRPGVRIEGSLPVFFHQSTVFGDTRKNSATSGTVKRLGMFTSVVFCSLDTVRPLRDNMARQVTARWARR
jgi:hypothetical protein